MTILEDGRAYLDFINSVKRLKIDPDTMTVTPSGSTNTLPFVYEGETFKILIDDNSFYIYEKDNSVGQVVMRYEVEGISVEDPYLINWGPMPAGGENALLLYSKQVWLDVRCFDKDSEDKELLTAIERFSPKYGDPSSWNTYSYEYLTEEEDESFYMNYLCVGAEHYYTVRAWCYKADRSTYEPIIQDIFENHLYFNDWE